MTTRKRRGIKNDPETFIPITVTPSDKNPESTSIIRLPNGYWLLVANSRLRELLTVVSEYVEATQPRNARVVRRQGLQVQQSPKDPGQLKITTRYGYQFVDREDALRLADQIVDHIESHPEPVAAHAGNTNTIERAVTL